MAGGRFGYIIDIITGGARRNVDDLTDDLERQEEQLNNIRETAATAFEFLGIGLGLDALKDLFLAVQEAGDEMNKFSMRTGIGIEELSRLGFAAQMSDSSLAEMSDSLKFLQKNLVDAAAGGAAKETFDRLGIAVNDSSNNMRSASDVMLDFADAMANETDASQRATDAMATFGRSGQALLPLLAEGGDAIREMMTEADRLGVTMSTEDAQAAAAFGDALDALKMSLMGLARVASGDTMTALTDLMSVLTEGVVLFKDASKWIDDLKSNFGALQPIIDALNFTNILNPLKVLKTLSGMWNDLSGDAAEFDETLIEIEGDAKKAAKAVGAVGGFDWDKWEKDTQDALNKSKAAWSDFSAEAEHIRRMGILETEQYRRDQEQETLDIIAEYNDDWAAQTMEMNEEIAAENRAIMEAWAGHAAQVIGQFTSSFGRGISQVLHEGKADWNELWKSAMIGAVAMTAELALQLTLAIAIKAALVGLGIGTGGFGGALVGILSGGYLKHGGGRAHGGLSRTGTRDDEVMYTLQRGEWVTPRRSVNRQTEPVLDYISRTGRAPALGGMSVALTVNISGGNGEDWQKITRQKIWPELQYLMRQERR